MVAKEIKSSLPEFAAVRIHLHGLTFFSGCLAALSAIQALLTARWGGAAISGLALFADEIIAFADTNADSAR